MDITVRNTIRNGVPLLELWQPVLQCRPIVVVQHGYMGRKEFILPQAYHLASRGFFVIVPDAWEHGDRGPGTPLASPTREHSAVTGVDLFMSVERTAAEYPALLAAYGGDPRTDTGRCGLVGYSMGGMIVFYCLTMEDSPFRVLCSVIGTPDWPSVLSLSEAASLTAAMGLTSPQDMTALRERARRDTPSRITRVRPVPLLAHNGGADPIIPPEPVSAYIDAIRPCYPDPDHLELHVHPGLGHADTVEINMNIAAWLQRFLEET